jgi:hypothetical protein
MTTVAALLVGCLWAACSPTVLTGSWHDPGYSGGRLNKVLVVGVSGNDLVRRLLEDEFARQFKAAGVPAEPSYAHFSVEELKEQRQQVEARIRNLGFEQVIVSRLVDRRTEEIVQPGTAYATSHPGGWGGYYHQSWAVVYSPPVSYQVAVATIESKLFALNSGKMIWSGLLETETGGTAMSENKETIIRSFVKVVIQDLGKSGLL